MTIEKDLEQVRKEAMALTWRQELVRSNRVVQRQAAQIKRLREALTLANKAILAGTYYDDSDEPMEVHEYIIKQQQKERDKKSGKQKDTTLGDCR